MEGHIKEALDILDENPSVSSMRLMPCPGPVSKNKFGDTNWVPLEYAQDSLVFTYQATIWRREVYIAFMRAMIAEIEVKFGDLSPKQKVDIQIKINVAETEMGKDVLKQVSGIHLAWPREGRQPNAVYLCPWPYRPTAVVHGKLEKWASELAGREEIFLDKDFYVLAY